MSRQSWKGVAFRCAVLCAAMHGSWGVARAQERTTAGVKQPAVERLRLTWRRAMARTARPKKGCFTATYPSRTWRELPCVTPRPIPFGPKHGVRPFTVGNGTDFAALVTGNPSAAEGTFQNGAGGVGEPAGGVANKYSPPVNTNLLPTPTSP